MNVLISTQNVDIYNEEKSREKLLIFFEMDEIGTVAKARTRHMNIIYIYIYIYIYTTAYENQDLCTNSSAEKEIVIDAEVVGT